MLIAALTGLAVAVLVRLKPGVGPQSTVAPPPSEPEKAAKVPDGKMPEEAKVRLEHHLQVERLLLDKLLIGALLILAGYGVNVLVEGIKASATQTQYLLDKRLDAAMKIRAALTAVTDPLQEITLRACAGSGEPAQLEASTRLALGGLITVLNSSSLLLKEEYLTDAERAISILQGTVAHDCYSSCDVRLFIDHVSQYVTDETKEQIMPGRPEVIAPRGTSFKPLSWSERDLRHHGNKRFMEQNFIEWRKKQVAPSPLAQICRKKA